MNKKKQFTLKEIANALVQEGIQRDHHRKVVSEFSGNPGTVWNRSLC